MNSPSSKCWPEASSQGGHSINSRIEWMVHWRNNWEDVWHGVLNAKMLNELSSKDWDERAFMRRRQRKQYFPNLLHIRRSTTVTATTSTLMSRIFFFFFFFFHSCEWAVCAKVTIHPHGIMSGPLSSTKKLVCCRCPNPRCLSVWHHSTLKNRVVCFHWSLENSFSVKVKLLFRNPLSQLVTKSWKDDGRIPLVRESSTDPGFEVDDAQVHSKICHAADDVYGVSGVGRSIGVLLITYSMKNTVIGTATISPHTPRACSAKTNTASAINGWSFKCAARRNTMKSVNTISITSH